MTWKNVISISIAMFLVILLSGCSGSKKKAEITDDTDHLQTVAIPVVMPPADPEPVNKDVTEARASAVVAKENVVEVIKAPTPTPANLVKLNTANTELGQTIAKLDKAVNTDIPELKKQLADEQANRKQTEDVINTNFEKFKAACAKDKESLTAANAELVNENKQIKDEELTKFKHMLYFVGGILWLIGAFSFAAEIWLGFAVGWRLAAICGTVGGIILAVAKMADTIILWMEYGSIAAFVIILGMTLYHYFHHTPNAVVDSTIATVETKATDLGKSAVGTLTEAETQVVNLFRTKVDELKSKL